MYARTLAFCSLFAATLFAQSPLDTIPTPFPVNWFLWTGCATPNVFFNLTVNATVTIQGLDVALDNQQGAQGTVELWVTNAGITTHVGNELNQANWTMRGSGPVVSEGQTSPARVRLTPGVVLQPGSYGIAVKYIGVRAQFAQGTGSNQVFSNAQLTLTAGVVQALSFSTAVASPFVWLGRMHYLLGTAASAAAANTAYGAGCNLVNGSFYQRFTCSGPASTALTGRALRLVPTGTGYAVVPGTGAAFIAPTAAAGSLPVNDDGETMVALTNAMPFPGGATQMLWVHTNGYVSVASNTTVFPNNFTPFVPGLLNAPITAWWSWHDYNPTEPGSGTIKFEEVGPLVLITWDDVESYPITQGTTPVQNRSTWQFQFDTATGIVTYVWQTITPVGGSTDSDEHVIGFSPGGASPDAGPIDIVSLTSVVLTVPEVLPLTLAAAPAPLLGNTVVYTTSNATGQSIGLFFFCAAQLPGVSLAPLGMPSCAAHVDIASGVGNLISNIATVGTMQVSLPIPAAQPALLGLDFFGQSLWLDAQANPFGATVSNGVLTHLGNF